jgi:acetylornithine deacetylase
MKGFIAVALAKVPEFLAAQERTPVHLALSYDEVVGCLGVHGLLADLEERGVRPAACIVGEPTDMRAIVAHKGKRDFCCRVRGLEAHSSFAPRAVNAIESAAEVIVFIRALAERLQRQEAHDDRFDVPFTTLQTGIVRGGIATNVVPRDCEFTFEMRNLPATSTQPLIDEIERFAQSELLPRMRRIAPAADIRFEELADLPAFGVAPEAQIVRFAQSLARTAHLGTGGVGFATEASLFARARIPTVLLGPGSIEQAHKPDEYISYAQVAACEAFFARLIAAPLPEF